MGVGTFIEKKLDERRRRQAMDDKPSNSGPYAAPGEMLARCRVEVFQTRDHQTVRLVETHTMAAVARRIGYNEATVSRYLAGTYSGDVDALESVFEEVIAADARRQVWRDFHVPTHGVDATIETIGLIRESCVTGLITGAAGLGKTTACNRYAAQNKSAILFTLEEGYGDNWSVIRHLFDALAIRGWSRQSGGATRADCVKDRLRNSGRVIIVDNAQRVTLGGLKWLLDMKDATGTPVALIGNPEVLSKVSGKDQLDSRIPLRRDIGDDAGKWVDGAADKIVDAMWPDAPGDVRLLARETARRSGHLRTLVYQLRIAIKLCEAPAWRNKHAAAFVQARALVGAGGEA